MAFTIEFDDNNLIEIVSDTYKRISLTRPLGMSFVDFLMLGDKIKTREHIYFKVADDIPAQITNDSYFYVRIREFVDICIKDTRLYNLENFMFFLHMQGLSIPENFLEYHIDPDSPVEKLVKKKAGMASLEIAIRGFDKSDKSKHAITCVYSCSSIEDALIGALYHLISRGFTVKKCSNCSRYFVPLRRSDAIYCDRLSPYNSKKTCKEDGSQRTFDEKLKSNDAEKLRRSIYLVKQMRVRRNPDIAGYKQDFEKWKTEVTEWKSDIKKGHRTSKDFISWLYANK